MIVASTSTANVAQALAGIDFPSDRKNLVKHAKKNKADKTIISVIEKMPDEEYSSMADVFKGVGMAQ